MEQILKKYPVPASGLILGLAAAGNLIQSYGETYRSIFGIISAILFVLMIIKIVKHTDGVRESLQNPVIASVFPTLSMAAMLLAAYLKPLSESAALILWITGLVFHILLIFWFSKKFVFSFKIKQVFPSWFIVYVGIAVAGVTAPAFEMNAVGQMAFWFGLISYIFLLPIVIYRTVKIKEIPEPAMPTLIIFAAPASLLLAGYMNSFINKNITMVWCLTALSIIMYIAAVILIPKLLRLKFYPSYSGFTFPLIISGIAMKLTNGYLLKIDTPISWLVYLVKFQEIIAVAITLYVLFRYMQFLFDRKKATI